MADEIEDTEEPEEPPDYADDAEPDVLLDVPHLAVEEIALDVETLRARVSLQAEVLDLLKLGVGVDAELTGVHLDIKGVDAEVLLKARLDTVAQIIDRVLTTVDRNPEIIAKAAGLVEPDREGAAETGPDRGGTGTVAGVPDVAGEAVKGVDKVLDTSSRLVEGVLGGGGRKATGSRADRPKRLRGREEQPP